MILHLYDLLFTLFLILYVPYSLLRSLFQQHLRKMLLHRMGFFPDLSEKNPVWIHAASVGEVICSVPLFKRIKKEFPGLPVLLTTMTQTGYHTAGKLFSEADWIFFFPFDHPFIIRRTTRRIEPRLLHIAKQNSGPISFGYAERRKFLLSSSMEGFPKNHSRGISLSSRYSKIV
jgi:3-deoxy-D-manno-octulosonic-acid transferase